MCKFYKHLIPSGSGTNV